MSIMKTFITPVLVGVFSGCAALKADISTVVKTDLPALTQCADQAALSAASEFLPAVTALLNSGPSSVAAQLTALEAVGKAGVLCSVDAIAEGAEAQISASPAAVVPAARLRAARFLSAHANK